MTRLSFSDDGFITPFTNMKRCGICHIRKPVVIICDVGNRDTFPLCKKHFKQVFPNYTLFKRCINCNKCFSCDIQDALFSKKEIKELKKKHFVIIDE